MERFLRDRVKENNRCAMRSAGRGEAMRRRGEHSVGLTSSPTN